MTVSAFTFLMTFLEGLASFISPCTLPLLPVYAVYFAGQDGSRRQALARAVAFVTAFSLVFVVMGAFAGSVGRVLAAHRTLVKVVCGLVVVALGLGYLGVFRLPFVGANLTAGRRMTGLFSAFVFGLAFALGLTPCVGAFLAAALLTAATEGTAVTGALLLLTYSLGLGVPLVLSALFLVRLKGGLNMIKRNYRFINPLCGAFLLVMGAWMAGGEQLKNAIKPASTNPIQQVKTENKEKKKMEITLTSANFEAEVLKSDIPVLVDFWAPWCGPCRMLGPIVSEIAEARAGTLKVGKVNVDEAGDLAAKYGIMSIPAVYLFKNGRVAAQSVGYLPKEELLKRLGL